MQRRSWILLVLVLAVLALYTTRRCQSGRRRWMLESFEDEYNCSQEWATCPNGPPNCYWGDKDWNKGKCCPKPWSSPDGCVDPIDPATGKSLYAA